MVSDGPSYYPVSHRPGISHKHCNSGFAIYHGVVFFLSYFKRICTLDSTSRETVVWPGFTMRHDRSEIVFGNMEANPLIATYGGA
jgi:hypothetical protein